MINQLLRSATLALLASTAFAASAAPCPTTAIAPDTTLPAGTVGASYTQTFAASGSALPYAFAITSGLPVGAGLGLSTTGNATADLSGAPTQAGDFLVTVTATDTDGCSGGRTYALAIGPGSQTIGFTSSVPTAAAIGGTPYNVSATATSNLPVSFAIDATAASVCSITGSSVSFQSVGMCVVNANQTGDANYSAAPQVQQSFAVGAANQTIAFTSTAPADAVVDGSAYAVTAAASSGLPVALTIDASASSVCAIAGSSVTFQSAGTCVINADQAGDADYNPAPQLQQSFAVAKGNQTISFTSTAPAGAAVGGTAYSVTATATSGLPVAFAIDASASAVCSITGANVSFQGTGTCVINANQAGDANYNAAPQVQQSFAVAIGSQTIAFTSTPPAGAVVAGATYTATATATSGLPVTFTIAASASTVCSITGSNVSFQGAGTCVIDANQAGNGNWNAAPQTQQSFAVGKGSQTISFTSSPPASAVVGGTYALTATASSGLPVTFTIDASASSVCAIAGSSVTFQGAGTCVINANQAGDADYNPAPQVQQSFAVAEGNQTISFTSTAPAGATVGSAAYSVTATATSGLPVAFAIDASASSVCSITGANVSFQGAGTCVINANQAGDADYNPAPQVQQSFAVAKGNQTISFTSTAPAGAAVGGASYGVTATTTSGLPVAFTIAASASAVCSIAGSTVSFQGAGTCVINANQAGDADYNPAPQLQQSFAVAKGNQTISFTSTVPAGAAVGGTSYSMTATATSGLPVAFTVAASASAVCSITGSSVSFQSVGTCVIAANQAGNANYNAAPQVQQSFAVGIGSQTNAFTSTPPASAVVAGATYTVTATATSGLPVTLTIDASASGVCSIAGSAVSFQSVGSCVIAANQAGNANYSAAPQVQQSFAVGAGNQTIAFTSAAPAGAVVAGATYSATAAATSGLPVTFTIDPSASTVCSITGSTISFQGAGTCVLDANQAGDGNWNAAPQTQQSFLVGQGSQTISFTSIPPVSAVVGGTYAVAATATSGLPVALTIDASASSVCAISGSTVSFLTAGTCVIDANQAGDGNWSAATQVQQSLAVSACISLAVGQVVRDSMPSGANFCVVNTDGSNAEYTYMPIHVGTSGEPTLSLTGNNIIAVTGPPTPIAPPVAAMLPLAALPDAPHIDVHGVPAPSATPSGQPIDASTLVRPDGVAGGAPLVVGQLIDLDASIGACSAAPDVRKARVEAITTAQSPGQQLLYAVQEVVETTPGAADWHPPLPGGFLAQDFQNIIDAFVQAPPGFTPGASFSGAPTLLKTGAMDVMTTNLGAPTDVDANSGVIVFFTRTMNALSPPASGSVAHGLFQSRDLFSSGTCPASNEGEILYLLLPDPTGLVNSNVRTQSFVYTNVGRTLVHHFEHLVNAGRRVYFNGAAALEETWLDEALAWEMQELVFFNASMGLGPRGNIQLSTLTTGPNASVRVNDFNTYENQIYGDMRTYFFQLNATNGNKRFGPLRQQGYVETAGVTGHEQVVRSFAITSTFLRYALDRRNTGDAALLQALVNSTQTGMANLQTVLGADPNDWMRDFIVAMYADDAGIPDLAAQYTAPSWNYRSLYGGLGGFPMAVNPLTNGVPLAFALSYGGGTRYARFGVAPGQTASVVLTEGGVSPTSPIATAIVRTK